jgi:hypothetical protein
MSIPFPNFLATIIMIAVPLMCVCMLRVVLKTVAAGFDVSSFGGSKAIVLSTMSYIGGKHNFMAISYLVVGIVCLLEGIVFGVLHMSRSRKLGDLTLLNELN